MVGKCVICAVHDGKLLREVVEDESCAFGGCGEGKEQVVIGGIKGDDPGRQGGQHGVIPPLRKSQHRGGDGREGTYTELELYMGRSGSEDCNFLGGSSSVDGLCTRLCKRDTANERIELQLYLQTCQACLHTHIAACSPRML